MDRYGAEPQLSEAYVNQAQLAEETGEAFGFKEVINGLGQVGIGVPVTGHQLADDGNQAVKIQAE